MTEVRDENAKLRVENLKLKDRISELNIKVTNFENEKFQPMTPPQNDGK